ncbi:MAG: thiamine pyrophosphate-binding protein [Actinomycetota bacterium]
MHGSDLLVECLIREGVTKVFGIPGAQPVGFLDSIYRRRAAGVEIDFVLTRHEQAAAHMADAWSRLTGGVGVCLGTAGPGATDLVPGVVAAQADSSPILVLTAQNQSFRIYPHHGSQQECNQLAMFGGITKFSACAYHTSRIPELVRAAMRAAVSGRPGPVHIDLPADVLFKEIEEDPSAIWDPHEGRATRGLALSPSDVEEISRVLLEAERPLLYLGKGVLRSGGWDEARALGEYLGAAITNTVGAKGVIPEDHPQALIAMSYGAMAAQNDSDVVLIVGTRIGELCFFGREPLWGARGTQKIIHIDADPNSIGLNKPVTIGAVADARTALGQLLDGVRAAGPVRAPHAKLGEYKLAQEAWLSQWDSLALSDAAPMHPLRVVKEVRNAFPREAIICVDGGNTAVWASYLMRVYEPRSLLWATNSGHLGAGLPFAIAAKMVHPQRPVFLLHGDGAFGFLPQELETARRLSLAVMDVIFNDRAFGMIKHGQRMALEGRHIGVDFADVRYDEMAKAMGCHGERVADPSELEPAIKRAVHSGLPAVLDVLVDQEANLTAPDTAALINLWLEGC